MTLSTIGTILCFSSVVFVLLNLLQMKRRNLITYELDHGIICYTCKQNIDYPLDSQQQWPPSNKKEQCLQCKRDELIGDLLETKRFSLENIVCHKKWKWIFLYLSIMTISIQVSNLFILSGVLSFFGGLSLFIIQFLNFLHFRYTSRPKNMSTK